MGFETGTKFHFSIFFFLGGDGGAGLLLFLLSGRGGRRRRRKEGRTLHDNTYICPPFCSLWYQGWEAEGAEGWGGWSLWCGAVVVTGGQRYGAGGWRRRETCDSNAPVTQLLLCSDI